MADCGGPPLRLPPPMSKTARLYKLETMIRHRGHASFADLLAALEVSPATLKRDLAYLRDRLGAPIEWDRYSRGYRFAQEALTNVTKHAQATRVMIDLSMSRGVLSLEVSDNGRGLSRRDLAKSRSFGLRGLQERAATVGGWIDLSSSARGTTLILSIPITASETPAPPAAHAGHTHEEAAGHDPSAWGNL